MILCQILKDTIQNQVKDLHLFVCHVAEPKALVHPPSEN